MPSQDEHPGDSSEWGYWDEDQWEVFFQEYDEKMDQCMEEIDRWWDQIGSKEEADEEGYCRRCGADEDEEWTADERDLDLLLEDGLVEDGDLFEEMPSWRAAYTFGVLSCDFVDLVAEDAGDLFWDDFDRLATNCLMVAAHIAGGHEMGYDDEVICGNIAKCKRALGCIDQCMESLVVLSQTYDDARRLLVRASVVRSFVESRIVELRKHVWW